MFRLTITLAALLLASVAFAQSPRPYDGIQAGLDAYHLAEASRQANLNHQILLNHALQYWPPPWLTYPPPRYPIPHVIIIQPPPVLLAPPAPLPLPAVPPPPPRRGPREY